MNKLDKNKQIERPKVEPLGDIRIAEARSKSHTLQKIFQLMKNHSAKLIPYRFLGVNEKGNYLNYNEDQI